MHLPMQDPSLPIFTSLGRRLHKPELSFPNRHLTALQTSQQLVGTWCYENSPSSPR